MVPLGDVQPKKIPSLGSCAQTGAQLALSVARAFRAEGIRAEMDLMERGLGAQMAHASKSADFAVVIGAREAEAGQVTLNASMGEQKRFPGRGDSRGESAWCSLRNSQSSSAVSVSRNFSRRQTPAGFRFPDPGRHHHDQGSSR